MNNEKNFHALDMDQKTIIRAFNFVMADYSLYRKEQQAKGRLKRSAFDEIAEADHWAPEWMSAEFVRVVNGESAEPRRVRDFVQIIGWKAEESIHKIAK